MDPLTAFSLAGNVIQFVDFGSKLLSRAEELYKSSQGSLAVNDKIELVTADLKDLITKLRVSFLAKDENEGLSQQDQVNLTSFRNVCDEAAKVADELVGRLTKLKLNGKHRKLRSLQHAVQSLWNEREVASLMKRLLTLKETLESHVLFSIRESLDTESLRASARFESLDRQSQQILTLMLELSTNANKNVSREFQDAMGALTVTITQLLSRLERINQEGHQRTRDKVLKNMCERERGLSSVDQVIFGIEMLNVSDTLERQLRTSIQESIIKSLRYPSMTYRYEDIIEAYPSTFDWAFKDPTEEQLPWSNLPDWLRAGDGVYWVCGKAGSGKSTFMKHVYDERQTRQFLSVWAGNHRLCVATFFFWNSGTREQKSQLGFLRSLLFQVLNQCPELVPLVLPRIWGLCYSKAVRQDWTLDNFDETWPLQQLLDALRALIHQKSVPLKLCFLIDGLDEFDGDHEQMGRLFQEITTSNNVKACLSSRPWVVFEYLFDSSPKLRLQNLTYKDIEHYVCDKLHQNYAYQRLATREPSIAEDFVHEIVHKAEGVFLWVKLVVHSLLNGIRNRDEMSDLWERLRMMPRELEPLYVRLLELVEPIYLPWVSKAFQILRANRNHIKSPFSNSSHKHTGVSPLAISAFFFAINENVNVATLKGSARSLNRSEFETKNTFEQLTLPSFLPTHGNDDDVNTLLKSTGSALQGKCEDTLVQLTARCAGFLEVSISDEKVSRDSLVRYFHRTARDFLETEEIWSKLLLQTGSTDFDPNTALMRSCVITLQLEPILIEAQKPTNHRESILRITKDCLIYSHYADAHHQSHGTQTSLLDQLCQMLTLHDSRAVGSSVAYDTQWIMDLFPKIPGFATFLEVATLFDLKAYVREEINRQDESRRQKLATSLLHYLLSSEDYNVYSSYLPLPGAEMVQLLLYMNANPNAACGSISAWERVLTYQASTAHQSSCPSLTNDERTLQCRYIEIMRLLLLFGANPEAGVVDHKRVQLTAIEIVENILVPRFPLEAAPLMQEVQEKTQQTCKSTKKRTHNKIKEINENGPSQKKTQRK